MNCANCNTKVDKGWNFCPKCGMRMMRSSFLDKILMKAVSRMGPFKDFDKAFQQMQKDIHRNKKSFSISIKLGQDAPPQIRIHPIGAQSSSHVENKDTSAKQSTVFSRKVSGEIKEPKTNVRKMRDKFVANILLPDIDSDKDIEIHKIGESIEIRAYAKDKTYFKILKCPPTADIVSHRFEKGKLLLEYV